MTDDLQGKEPPESYTARMRSNARGALEQLATDADPATSRWVGERLCPEFAPPSQRLEVEAQITVEQIEEQRADLLRRMNAMHAEYDAKQWRRVHALLLRVPAETHAAIWELAGLDPNDPPQSLDDLCDTEPNDE
jgi:Lon protease-like protein